MTMSEWFRYQRLIEHYEDQASQAHFVAATAFAFMGIMVLLGIFLAAAGVSAWWIVAIPTFAFMALGIAAMTDAAEAREMIEYIKWRM